MFGRMSPTEWGKLLQIHLDYRLKQLRHDSVSRWPMLEDSKNAETEIQRCLMTREHIQQAIDIIYNQIFNQGRADLLPVLFRAIHSAQPAFP